MKKCRDIENDLPLYLDDSLSGTDKQALEEHLKSCPQCTKALVQLSNAMVVVNSLAKVKPPPWCKEKIMARVREEAEKKSFAQKWFHPLRIKIPVQIFATVFIAVLAVYIYRAGDERMKEDMTSSVPKPVIEVQKDQLPEQKMKTSVNEAIQKEETLQKRGVPREGVREAAVDAARKVNGQIIPDIKAGKYESAPAAKSLEQSGMENKKENNTPGAAMKAGRAPQGQSLMTKPNVLLKVADINTAAGEVEKLLIKYEAKNISRQMAAGKAILKAELRNQKIEDFTKRLKIIGQIEESNVSLGSNTESNIPIVIELVK